VNIKKKPERQNKEKQRGNEQTSVNSHSTTTTCFDQEKSSKNERQEDLKHD
jgi:hypothetical protein